MMRVSKKSKKEKASRSKESCKGERGRESRKAEGRAQKLAAKREPEGILAEGGGGGWHILYTKI